MSSRIAGPRGYRLTVVLFLTFAACFVQSCSNQPRAGNANSSSTSANKNGGAVPDSRVHHPVQALDVVEIDGVPARIRIRSNAVQTRDATAGVRSAVVGDRGGGEGRGVTHRRARSR